MMGLGVDDAAASNIIEDVKSDKMQNETEDNKTAVIIEDGEGDKEKSEGVNTSARDNDI